MKTLKPTAVASQDKILQQTMRLAGIALALCSLFFLIKNFSLGMVDDVFFMCCLGLGIFTVAASWMPDRNDQQVRAV